MRVPFIDPFCDLLPSVNSLRCRSSVLAAKVRFSRNQAYLGSQTARNRFPNSSFSCGCFGSYHVCPVVWLPKKDPTELEQ